MAFNVYASEELPTIPMNDDGTPKPPPYLAPAKMEMTSTPGAKDYATCNGVYHQEKKEAYADWYNEKGTRALFYCPRFKVWACSAK